MGLVDIVVIISSIAYTADSDSARKVGKFLLHHPKREIVKVAKKVIKKDTKK